MHRVAVQAELKVCRRTTLFRFRPRLVGNLGFTQSPVCGGLVSGVRSSTSSGVAAAPPATVERQQLLLWTLSRVYLTGFTMVLVYAYYGPFLRRPHAPALNGPRAASYTHT
jgi:hypothetical protein